MQNPLTDAVIVFDIGGTYFRSAISTQDNKLEAVSKQSAFNFRSENPSFNTDPQNNLIEYLISTARSYSHFNSNEVSIALGAALNSNTGMVYASGPLWGKTFKPFNLLKELKNKAHEFNWHLVNDVTAGLLHYVKGLKENLRKIMLITISSGIACKIWEVKNQRIPSDDYGLQGEIGHLPVNLIHDGRPLKLFCDCGQPNHLAAFASGRGICELVKVLSLDNPLLWESSQLAIFRKMGLTHEQAFYQALLKKDAFASNLLHLATVNIADIIRCSLTLDPEIDRIILCGGVVLNLGIFYLNTLLSHFHENGIYLTSAFAPNFISNRISIATKDEVNNLIGAAQYFRLMRNQKLICTN